MEKMWLVDGGTWVPLNPTQKVFTAILNGLSNGSVKETYRDTVCGPRSKFDQVDVEGEPASIVVSW